MIEFKEGAVCYAGKRVWRDLCGSDVLVSDRRGGGLHYKSIAKCVKADDFQLNTIKQGDYIEASELYNEQKYNNAVEVFGLFGFRFEYNVGRVTSFEYILMPSDKYLGVNAGGYIRSYQKNISSRARKLTYPQLMAIGELKRKMDERESEAETIELLSDESMQCKISNIGNMIHNISCSTDDEETQDELGDHAFNLWDLAKQVGALERKELNLKSEINSNIDEPQFGKNEDGSMKLVKSNFSEKPNSSEQVKNPSHYQLMDGIESIEIIARSMTQEQWKGFCLGNMLKYRVRAGKKDKLQQDIDKANFYGELYEMHKGKCYD